MRMRRVGAAVVAAGVLLVAGASPAAAAPTVQVTPSTGLGLFQNVTVSGSGFAPNTFLDILQCGPGGEVDFDECDTRSFGGARTDAAGSFSTTFIVRRIQETDVDGRVDCSRAPAGTCNVGVGSFEGGGSGSASTPLSFAPDAPIADIEVTVAVTSATVEDNVGRLEGVVRCANQDGRVFLDGRVRQVVRRFFIDAEFFVSLECRAGVDVPFTAVFEGRNGELRRGDAEVRIDAFASNVVDNDQFTLLQDIELQPK